MPNKKHATIGCCGIDCGLCPRYYTGGASRCPGCGGENFAQKHPPCSFITCCVKKHSLEACGQCGDFACQKFEKETGERDSFVTHRKVLENGRLIKEAGIDAFFEQQARRMAFLQTALAQYDDGRSKGFLCLAAALLSIGCLEESLALAAQGEPLRGVLARFAEAEGQELRLRK